MWYFQVERYFSGKALLSLSETARSVFQVEVLTDTELMFLSLAFYGVLATIILLFLSIMTPGGRKYLIPLSVSLGLSVTGYALYQATTHHYVLDRQKDQIMEVFSLSAYQNQKSHGLFSACRGVCVDGIEVLGDDDDQKEYCVVLITESLSKLKLSKWSSSYSEVRHSAEELATKTGLEFLDGEKDKSIHPFMDSSGNFKVELRDLPSEGGLSWYVLIGVFIVIMLLKNFQVNRKENTDG